MATSALFCSTVPPFHDLKGSHHYNLNGHITVRPSSASLHLAGSESQIYELEVPPARE
jgi:hypothetical protein